MFGQLIAAPPQLLNYCSPHILCQPMLINMAALPPGSSATTQFFFEPVELAAHLNLISIRGLWKHAVVWMSGLFIASHEWGLLLQFVEPMQRFAITMAHSCKHFQYGNIQTAIRKHLEV